jgi:phage-related minor tail protein
MAEQELGQLDIRLSMDNSDFNKAVRGVTDSVKDVRKDFRLLEAELRNVEKTEEGLSDGLRRLNGVLDSQKDNVKQLEKAYERQVQQFGENSREARRMNDALREARIDMERTRTTIGRTNTELERLRENSDEASEGAGGLGEALGGLGEGGLPDLQGVFEKLGGTKGGLIGATILGVAGLATAFHNAREEGVKASQEIELGLMSVSDEIDITGRDLEKMAEKYGKSIEEIVQDTRSVHEQLQGLVEPDMYEDILKDAELVSKVTGTDVRDGLVVVEKMMRTFGLTSDEAFGYYLTAIEEGLGKGEDFVDTISEYGNEMKTMGLTADEVMAGLNAGLEAGAMNTDIIADSWREFNMRATTEDTGFKDALAKLKDESLTQLYDKVLAGEVPMDTFMRTAVEKLKGVDNQRLLNEIGIGLFGDKWLEAGGSAVLASADMVGKDEKSGLKGVNNKLAETKDKIQENKTGWQKIGEDFKKKVTDPMLDGLETVWQKLGDLLWRLKETGDKNKKAYEENLGQYRPKGGAGPRAFSMAVPTMRTFAMATSTPSMPDNRPFSQPTRAGSGTVVNLSVNAPQELSASEVAKRTRQTLNQMSLSW